MGRYRLLASVGLQLCRPPYVVTPPQPLLLSFVNLARNEMDPLQQLVRSSHIRGRLMSSSAQSGGNGMTDQQLKHATTVEENNMNRARAEEKKLINQLHDAMQENEDLKDKTQKTEDKYIRALAELENVRNRLTKQISDSKLYAIQGFCKDLLEIADILALATDSVSKENLEKIKELKQLFEGVTMTEAQLLKIFKKHGLVQINPIDQKFDPNEHEAVVQQEVEGKESGTVIFVSKLGYKLHDRVVRPAVVGVAK